MGQRAAAAAAAAWVDRVRAVVVCGVAGGTGEHVQAGEVVVASRLIDAAGAGLAAVVPVELGGAPQGVVASVDHPVADRDGLLALRARGAVAVETEAASWARASATAGVPVAVVRGVLDTPDAPLGPAAGLVRLGASGPAVADVVRVAVRPRAWSALLAAGRRVGTAERNAADAAVRVARRLVQEG